MAADSPRVSGWRLLLDLAGLAEVGGRPDGGVDRVAGSAADIESRRWLVQRMEEAGLEAEIDEAGNVLGRLPGAGGPRLLVGSHTDTVPAGGRLDGAYGVLAGLEVVRALAHAEHPMASAVEVVSFADEEGVGAGGGLSGSRALVAGERAGSISGYLELHIEQGPRLEAEGLALGVVEGIMGLERWDLVIRGEANHAGTTPMDMRRDAGRPAARVLEGLRRLIRAVDPEMVGNVGQLRLRPGAPNVVPGEAAMVVELRALKPDSLRAASESLRRRAEAEAAEDGCTAELRQRSAVAPVAMDPRVVGSLAAVCERSGRGWRRLVSRAGHDAMILSQHVPSGMLFVPSRGGFSHSPREHTDDAQLILGTQALLESVIEVGSWLLADRPQPASRRGTG